MQGLVSAALRLWDACAQLGGPHPTFAYAKATFSRFAGEGDAPEAAITPSPNRFVAALLRNDVVRFASA